MSQDSSIGSLVNRLRAGDQDALSELIQLRGDAIHRIADALLRRYGIEKACDADDIRMEVLSRLWKECRQVDGGPAISSDEKFRIWLWATAKAAVQDEIERINRRSEQEYPAGDFSE